MYISVYAYVTMYECECVCVSICECAMEHVKQALQLKYC